MLSGLHPSTETYLNDLERIQQRLDRAQRQISSGKRMERISDDPDQVSSLLQVRALLHRTEAVQVNLGRVQVEVDTAEQCLQSAVKLVERATVLGAQGVSGTQTAATRTSIAGEVRVLLEQLVGLTSTSVEGRYIFSGDSDQVVPYTVDLSQANGVSAYAGSGATRKTMHPTGVLFPIAMTAQELLDNADPNKNVFLAVNNLRLALENSDETAIGNAIMQLRSAGDHLNAQLAFYGTVQNQVTEAVTAASQMKVRLESELSVIEDADLAAAILESQQASYQQQAALAVKSKMPTTSLFDFIR